MNTSQAISITPFPEITDIFTEYLEDNRLIFLPLCSIQFPQTELNGARFHIVSFGNWARDEKFLNQETGFFVLKFKMVNNKYYFCDHRFKFLAFEYLKNHQWYEEALNEFDETKEQYFSSDYRKFLLFEYLNNDRDDERYPEQFHTAEAEIFSPLLYEEELNIPEFVHEKRRREYIRAFRNPSYYLYVDTVLSYLVEKERFLRGFDYTTPTPLFIEDLDYSSPLRTYFTSGEKYRPGKRGLIDVIGGYPVWKTKDKYWQMEDPFVNQTGESLLFIAQLDSRAYHDHGPSTIYLFYDQEGQEVIELFKWEDF